MPPMAETSPEPPAPTPFPSDSGYYPNTDAIIFVVDASDSDRISIASHELHSMLAEEELKDAKLLVFANKQDAPGSISAHEVQARFGLKDSGNTPQVVLGTTALSGDGINQGVRWLMDTIKASPRAIESESYRDT